MKKLLLLLLFYPLIILAQQKPQVWNGIEFKVNNSLVETPYTGGFNNPVFSRADINNDGKEDLVVFEKSESRFYTFLNIGITGEIKYEFAPEYAAHFPAVDEFALLDDYNCDDIPDLFYYSPQGAGIAVAYGEWLGNNKLSFIEINRQLRYIGGANIYADPVKLPSFVDVNKDGDLDIIIFEQQDFTVGYYENQSQELGFGCDSLIYKKITNCWGYFCECSTIDNSISLNHTSPACFHLNRMSGAADPDTVTNPGTRHTGSTILAFDYDKDGKLEVLIGDASFDNLFFLKNTTAVSRDSMISKDSLFPSYSKSISVPVFPAAFYIDVNNDNLKDLIVAPFNQNVCVLNPIIDTSANVNNVWLYLNIGTAARDSFQFVTDQFLVGKTIDLGDNTKPVFFDYNADGLLDIVVGNCFYYDSEGDLIRGLALFENTGTVQAPAFTLVDRDYMSLSSQGFLGMHPTFGDLDDDGDKDLIIGLADGTLLHLENTATSGNPPAFQLKATNYQNIIVSGYATPQLVDVNRDGKMDMIIGEVQGRLFYYKNTGTATTPVFTLVTGNPGNRWGLVDVRGNEIYGFSDPYLADLNYDGKYELMVGSFSGKVYYYEGIEDSLDAGKFQLKDNNYIPNYAGRKVSVSAGFVNNDTKWDFVMGNARGGLQMYSHDTGVGVEEIATAEQLKVLVYPNPAKDQINIAVEGSLSSINIELTDIAGRSISKKVYHQQATIQIDVSAVPAGLYFLRIEEGNKAISKKVVIQ